VKARERIAQRKAAGDLFPVGRPYTNLPLVTEMTFGLQGIVLVAGPTKIGKTTLAAHLVAGTLAEDFPGVYYESEDGLACERIAHVLGEDDPRLDHLDYESDFTKAVLSVRERPAPGFLVIDTIQGSTDLEDHDGRLDAGVLRALERRTKVCVELMREGYAVLVISQINDRTTKAPPAMSAIKGASAIEQAASTVLAYGIAGQDRALVLRALRRPHHPAWPDGSRVVLKTDGQDRLTEAGRTAEQTTAPVETIYQKVDRIMTANPLTSAAKLGEQVGLKKAQANLYQRRWRASGRASGADGDQTVDQTGSTPRR
jgi:hypothetical protein